MEYQGGTIEISDSVIKEIIFRSIVEYMDIGDNAKEQKKLRKNIGLQRTPEDHLIITLKISVPFKIKDKRNQIPEYVGNLMKKLSEDVESMTEMKIESIKVKVEEIVEKFESESMEETQQEEEEEEKEEI